MSVHNSLVKLSLPILETHLLCLDQIVNIVSWDAPLKLSKARKDDPSVTLLKLSNLGELSLMLLIVGVKSLSAALSVRILGKPWCLVINQVVMRVAVTWQETFMLATTLDIVEISETFQISLLDHFSAELLLWGHLCKHMLMCKLRLI